MEPVHRSIPRLETGLNMGAQRGLQPHSVIAALLVVAGSRSEDRTGQQIHVDIKREIE